MGDGGLQPRPLAVSFLSVIKLRNKDHRVVLDAPSTYKSARFDLK